MVRCRATSAEVDIGGQMVDGYDMLSYHGIAFGTDAQSNEKKRLAVRSRNFYLFQEIFYHKGGDGILKTVCSKQRKNDDFA